MIRTLSVAGADGVRCGARFSGDSGDTIIFVHGVGSTAAVWDSQTDELRKTYRCYAVELRGNGRTSAEPPASCITREGYVEDVIAVANAAGADRFHFIGCSLGGAVGLELWKRSAQRVRSFVFIGAFAAYPNGEKTAAAIIRDVRAAEDMHAFAQARTQRLFSPETAPRRYRETIEQMACKNVESYVAATRATWTGDYRPMLRTISVPTLVLCGERDQIAPLSLSRELAESIAGAELVVVAGANHIANADRPQEVNRLVSRFLSRLST